MKNDITVKVGTQFRHIHADSKPLWEVIRKDGPTTWICEIIEDEWKGTTRAFRTQDIRGAIGMAQLWQRMGDESERWYQSLRVGSFVHQRNSGGYVRCRVNEDHQVVPVALLGKWFESDLPSRRRNGEIYYGYHAEKIQKAEPFKPHASHFYEFKHEQNEVDPSQLQLLVLTVPPMTQEQEREAKLWQKVESIRKMTGNNDERDPRAILNMIKDILDDYN